MEPDRPTAVREPVLPLADLGSLALLAILPVWLLWLFIFQGQVLYYRDITLVFQPATEFIRQSLLRGELPLWNPLLAGGYPQIASLEPPLFYPGMLLFYMLSYGPALTIFVLLNHLGAGWGMYALGRFWGLSRSASLLAALTYSYSGYLVTSSNLYPSQAMAALFPGAVLALERALRYPQAANLALATAVWGIQLSGTRPDLTLMEAILISCLAAARWNQARSRGDPAARRQPVICALVFGGALLLNAASYVPALEFVLNSTRGTGIPPAEAQAFSFSPVNALSLFVPTLFGDAEWHTDWGRYLIGEPALRFTTFYLSLYMGWLPWLLLPVAWRSRRPDTAWLMVLGGIALVLAMGRNTPLYNLFLTVFPPAGFMRYPVKFFFLVTWCLAVLAGHGLDELHRRPVAFRHYLAVTAILAGLLLVGWFTALVQPDTWIQMFRSWDYRPWLTGPIDFDINAYMHRLWPLLFPEVRSACGTAILLALLGIVGMYLAVGREGRSAGYRTLPVLLVVIVDLPAQNGRFNWGAPADYYQRGAAVGREMLRRPGPRLFRFYKPLGQSERLGSPRQIRLAEMAAPAGEPFQLTYHKGLRERLSSQIAMSYRLQGVYAGVSLTPYHSVAYLLEDLRRSLPAGTGTHRFYALAGAFNVRYLLVPFAPFPAKHPLPPALLQAPGIRLIWQDRLRGVWLFENEQVLPRAHCVSRAIGVGDVGESVRKMTQESINLEEIVLLEGTNRGRSPTTAGNSSLATDLCQVDLLKYRNNQLVAAAVAGRSSYLVLSDNHYPGWVARLDGWDVPILRANGVVRSVEVPPGRHVVEFQYRPLTVLLGVIISLLGWGLVLWWLRGRVLEARY